MTLRDLSILFGSALLILCSLHVQAASDRFSFAVLGDNRGDSSGELSPVFLQVLKAVQERSPRFVVNTGDMIYGRTNGATARGQWAAYTNAISRLQVPFHHVPGNHDIWGPESAALYRDIIGPSHFVLDYGHVRIIGLDTETHESRLGAEQFAWLRRQLAETDARNVFVALHRPLFPVDGGIGTSLDAYPAQRDELHRLFVEHRSKVQAVFQGHEHLFHLQVRDGVRYYTTGGGGANLYEFPELGGFHHFLLVHVSEEDARVELVKVGAPQSRLEEPIQIKPNAVLESWEDGLFWYTWNYTVTAEIERRHAGEGARGLRLNFDLVQCPWPVLATSVSGWDPSSTAALLMDVFVPSDLSSVFTLTPAVEGNQKFAFSPARLRPGWNTVRADLTEAWRGAGKPSTLRGVEWGLTAEGSAERGWVIFDNLRAESSKSGTGTIPAQVLEGWERPLLWRTVDESVAGQGTQELFTQGKRGMKLTFDFSQCPRPMLLSHLNPIWDLGSVGSLALDVFVPAETGETVALSLGVRAQEVSHLSPPVSLHPGWNKVGVELDWLPAKVRRSVEQVELRLSSPNKTTRGWVVFDNLRAGGS